MSEQRFIHLVVAVYLNKSVISSYNQIQNSVARDVVVIYTQDSSVTFIIGQFPSVWRKSPATQLWNFIRLVVYKQGSPNSLKVLSGKHQGPGTFFSNVCQDLTLIEHLWPAQLHKANFPVSCSIENFISIFTYRDRFHHLYSQAWCKRTKNSQNSTYRHCFHKAQYKTVDPGLLLRTVILSPTNRMWNFLNWPRNYH